MAMRMMADPLARVEHSVVDHGQRADGLHIDERAHPLMGDESRHAEVVLVENRVVGVAQDDQIRVGGGLHRHLSSHHIEEEDDGLRCLEDLHTTLKKHGDWMPLGSADEGKPAADGTVEAWARSPKNPVGGWYGLKKGLRGRFANYVPPVMEALGSPRRAPAQEQPHAGDLAVDPTM